MRAKGVFLILILVLALPSCIESRFPTQLRTHPAQYVDPASADFHGTRVLARGDAECLVCHRAEGPGLNRVPSCDECHLTAGGHPVGWLDPASPVFHGLSVAARGPTPCKQCHGADYRGGTAAVSCYTCHADGPSGHPDGWLNPRAATFHGLRVLQHGLDDCRRCHGGGLDGGTSGVSCTQCHDDVEGGD
jgi:hypothetical protein